MTPRKLKSLAFYGFGGLIAVDVVAVALLNPDPRDFEFWIKLALFFAQIGVWSVWIASRLSRGKGDRAAFIFLFILTTIVMIGAIQSISDTRPKPWNTLAALRLVTGAYLLLLWSIVVWTELRKRPAGADGA